MSTLLLHLPLHPAGAHTEYSYTLTADGHQALQQGCCAPALLPLTGRAGERVAVVPAQALSWQRVTLPQKLALGHNQRLRAVLEGLLEDRLLDEPAQLHFALQPGARAGDSTWVAVCGRDWLQQHLQLLESSGHPVARIVPEWAPATEPDPSPRYCAVGTPGDAWLLASSVDPDHGVARLPLAQALALWGPLEPGSALRADPAVAALTEQLVGRPVELVAASSRALEAARSPWDLAQLDLASQGRTRWLRQWGRATNTLARAPEWRAARWGAGLLLATHLIGLNAWAWQERHSLADKQASVRALLTQTFPQVKVVVDAPVQMERELALLRQATGSLSPRDLEPLLAASAQALSAHLPGASAQAIDFSPGQLRLRGLSPSPEALQALQEQLSTAGYLANMDNDTLVVQARNGL